MTDYRGAVADICDRFLAVWSHHVVWDNESGALPDKMDPWARVTIRHAYGGSAAIGNRIFNHGGLVFVQIFVPAGWGSAAYIPLVDIAKSAYEGVRTPLGVWYKNVRVNEVGVDGRWYQVNVIAEFEYDEVKNG